MLTNNLRQQPYYYNKMVNNNSNFQWQKMDEITELFSQLTLPQKIMVHNHMDAEIRKTQQNDKVMISFWRFLNDCTFLKIPNILNCFHSLYNQRHDETAFYNTLGMIIPSYETQLLNINPSVLFQELLQFEGYINHFKENPEALEITQLSILEISILLEIKSSLPNQLVQKLKMQKQSQKISMSKKQVGYERNLPPCVLRNF